ncbi:ABC transporter substrate-binding protein [Georgenia sp. SYP-B2076]|uniref:ABC transporter substrate-binding protein n=1 Tax=Georgenia sp. SYP-B2076 TaxID=2495881 RepID=UPI0013E02AE5|nr:ABC transporter substrate-binding protein [Georgenia sp. SYP-B2076]
MKFSRKSRIVTLGAGITLALAACSSSTGDRPGGGESGEDPITVGVLLPLTGSLSALGNEMYNGYKVAQAIINEQGGIDGRPIEFKVSDAPTPEDAVAVAGTLSMDPDVSVIMGSYSSGIAIPASEVANRNSTVYWETGSAAAETTERGLEHLLRTNISVSLPAYQETAADFFDDVVGPAMAKDFSDVRVGMVYEDSAFGTSSADAVRQMAADNDWNLVADLPYTATANDLSSVIENLKSADVEFLYAISYVNDAILLMKQSQELGFEPGVVFGSGAGFTTPDIAEALGDRVNGILAGDGAPLGITDELLNDGLSTTYEEWTAKYEEMIGRPPLAHATMGFHGAYVLFEEVLPHADVSDPDSILEAARSLDLPDGGTPTYYGVQFDETGQNVRAGYYIMQYHDGIMKTVYPNAAAAAEFTLMGE